MADLTFDTDMEDRQCVSVSANMDGVVEGTENFTLFLESGDDVVLLPDQAEVEIVDSISKPSILFSSSFFSHDLSAHISVNVVVAFAQPSYTFSEEDGLGTIEVVKSNAVSEPFTVKVQGGICRPVIHTYT